jgi:hypothetical protein
MLGHPPLPPSPSTSTTAARRHPCCMSHRLPPLPPRLRMAIWVWDSCHPWGFDPTGAGANLHLWVHPNPTRTYSSLDMSFILHPWVHLPPEIWPTSSSPTHLLCCHMYISRSCALNASTLPPIPPTGQP